MFIKFEFLQCARKSSLAVTLSASFLRISNTFAAFYYHLDLLIENMPRSPKGREEHLEEVESIPKAQPAVNRRAYNEFL